MANEMQPAVELAGSERALIQGDLSKLNEQERQAYYLKVCESTGLNPFTQPFEYVTFQGKLKLYARRDATDQLRRIHGISISKIDEEQRGDVYVVTAHATDARGRTDLAKGAVNLAGLKGADLANAFMKAETKAKRRVTLSICGLGFLDETEVETVQGAQVVQHEPARQLPAPEAKPKAKKPAQHRDGPKTTEEMLGRLTDADDWMFGRRLCESGALVAYVKAAVEASETEGGLGIELAQCPVSEYPFIRGLIERYQGECEQAQQQRRAV